ncbi:quaternary amine ABC transporter ATP-binding protein [Solidesulfovibrio sp. C21]|uniref:quaternary amine ABC transporter ATP-binding protein n=1 Tax=Solidesulfovibrio sp. C21 TaxID=3398613 RepID=UPI0039FBE3A8
MEKIIIQNLVKIFGDKPEKALSLLRQGHSKKDIMAATGQAVGVADVSFTVDEGEIMVIMGLSGSGKSTLVRLINRLIEPTSGKVVIDGQDVGALSERELTEFRRTKFGMVFQNFALLPHRTVAANVEFGLEIKGMPPIERQGRAMDALKQVGLSGWEDRKPAELSGGMQQRVGLARALALDPDILLMDEAFSALDPLIRRDMQDELLSLQDTVKKTILFITHDLDEAVKLGDHIVLMKDGAVVQTGTAEDILTNPASRYVERFVEDVDFSKVLSARSVMLPPAVTALARHDGPRLALHKMAEAGISSLFVIGRDKRLEGMVTAMDASDAVRRGERSLDGVVRQVDKRVSPDASVQEVMPLLAADRAPVAVVDEANKLLGIIVQGSLLAGLADKGRGENGI